MPIGKDSPLRSYDELSEEDEPQADEEEDSSTLTASYMVHIHMALGHQYFVERVVEMEIDGICKMDSGCLIFSIH